MHEVHFQTLPKARAPVTLVPILLWVCCAATKHENHSGGHHEGIERACDFEYVNLLRDTAVFRNSWTYVTTVNNDVIKAMA